MNSSKRVSTARLLVDRTNEIMDNKSVKRKFHVERYRTLDFENYIDESI
jgi:hypothetical protein